MKKTYKLNSLFHYMKDNFQNILKRYSVKFRAYEKREVFYMHLLPLNDFKSENWHEVENHFSVEKRVLPLSDFMSPSHLTITLKHSSLSNKRCRIHVYFDEMLDCQTQIQIKIFNESDKGKEILKVYTLDYFKTSPQDIIVEGTNLNMSMIQAVIENNKPILTELMQNKFNAYMKYRSELPGLEQQLNALISHVELKQMSVTHLVQVLESCQKYLSKTEIVNRYSDSEQEHAEFFLLNLKMALEAEIAKRKQRIAVITPIGKEESAMAAQATAQAPVQEVPQNKLSLEKKLSIEGRVRNLKTRPYFKKIEDMIAHVNAHSQLQVEFVLLSLEPWCALDRAWVNQMMQELDKFKICLVEVYQQKMLAGDLEAVKQLEAKAPLQVDRVKLFAKLIEQIESAETSTENRILLIQIANYYYHTSDIYRAFIHYYVFYKYSLFELYHGMGEMDISLLIKMFLNNNYPAFEMYVTQVGHIHAIHVSHAGLGFNALQGIALLNSGEFSTQPYVELLLKKGAELQTTVVVKPVQSYELKTTTKNKSASTPSYLSIFEQMRANRKSLKLGKVDIKHKSSEELAAFIRELTDANHMLRFFIKTNLLLDARMVLSLVQHVDIKTLALNLVGVSMYNFCNISIVPSYQPGMQFFSEDKLGDVEEETTKIFNSSWTKERGDDPNLTLSVKVFSHLGASKDKSIQEHHLLKTADGMVRQLEVVVQKINEKEMGFVFDALEKELIPHLIKNPKLASEYCLALLILKSYYPNKKAQDFQALFLYASRFAMIKDRILLQTLGINKYQVLEKIQRKLSSMLALINPEMHDEITKHPILTKLKT